MQILFEEDLEMIKSAILNGDIDDAINLIDELKEESINVLKPKIEHLNLN